MLYDIIIIVLPLDEWPCTSVVKMTRVDGAIRGQWTNADLKNSVKSSYSE